MRVTLICDASYCNRYKVAGYGFWIASPRGKRGGSGQVLQEVENNNTAEMMAICNSIWHAMGFSLLLPGDVVLIQSDCLSAMDKLKGEQVAKTEQEKLVLTYFDKTIHHNNLTVEFRHVRGHTSHQGARFYANRICDQRAKREMRKARGVKIIEELKGELSATA